MPAELSKLIEKLRGKYPKQLKKEPLLDEIEDIMYDEEMPEDMEGEEGEEDFGDEEGVTPPQDILGPASDEEDMEDEEEDDELF
ncbi:hypothetical protein OAF54_00040 [bacterium]|nr:hypothetical protein [bacterium]